MSHMPPNDLPGAIAIIGLAGRFPQARNLDEFWKNISEGREVVTFFSDEELLAAGLDPELIKNPNYVPARAALEDAEFFDASFFGYSPREAQIIDPQQRVFLECAWEALENAGYDPDRYRGSIGVYAGLSMNLYLLANVLANPDAIASSGAYQVMLGNDKDFLTTRVSYKLNLKGPSVNVQTACSTSLVAVHQACQSLLNYQCDIALGGGVSITSPRKGGYLYQTGMIMSPDGHCRAFDHKAQGIVAGEGVGIVVLKRYSDAVHDGDTIHAIIRGTAINNDGGIKVGYTAPSVDGQTAAILMAQAVADVDPRSITYIEAHGTGTELGDPIEISALSQAFRNSTQDTGFCAIGSVKTHMGHLDAAAGVAGLIKTVLALKNRKLPPNLNFEKPNPRIDFEHSPFYVNASLKEWDTTQLPRRAGVSSFGIGGTNAHVVLEEAQPVPAGLPQHPEHLLLFSASSEAALNTAAKNFGEWLRRNPQASLADAAYTLKIGRKSFKHRRILVCASSSDAVSALEAADGKRFISSQQDAKDNPVAFMFTGQGSQYVQMGRDLYEGEPFFRQQVDACADILKPHLGLDLRTVLYPNPDGAKQAEDLIGQTWLTQPALFTIEYSLAKLWMSWGIQPHAMVGHSIGEYVAACLAGVFTLEDGLALVAARGKMMQSMPAGSMLSVPLSEADILPLLNASLSLAVINGPKMCVVSGPDAAIESLQNVLTARSVVSRKLHTSHAFHSSMMEPILAPFIALVKTVSLHEPQIPYLSNVTGNWITAGQAVDPAYWADHLRSTVRFSQNVAALFKEGQILLEVGPGQTLTSLARQHPEKTANQSILSSMHHPQEQVADTAFITTTLGRLWLSGAAPDWKAYHAAETLQRIPLPTYPFERKRFWLEPQPQKRPAPISLGTPKKRQDLSSWFYTPSWQRSTWPGVKSVSSEKHTWLIFCDSFGVGQSLSQQLGEAGHTVIMVRPGETFAQTGEMAFTLQPEALADYSGLFKSLSKAHLSPTRILHLWTLTGVLQDSWEELMEMQSMGFYSLLGLEQALCDREYKQPIQMLVVSNSLHEVTGGENLCAAKSTLLGPCKVISQEHPDISCRSVDIILPDRSIAANKPITQQILAEFDLVAQEPVVAHRGAHRWIQTYIPNPYAEASQDAIPLRQGGVYLITGGYGGIGLTLASYLAQAVKARLILVGRGGLPDREDWQDWLNSHEELDRTSSKIRHIQALENLGASVRLVKADITDQKQMQSLYTQIKTDFGSLNGVIHAAGVAGGGVIQLKTKDQAANVLSPKVEGTWILDRVFGNEPLDFVLLCSSINAVVGGIGQVDYCAANLFMDSFAAMKNGAGSAARYLSADWTAWQEVGMAVETEVPSHLKHWKEENLRNGIHPSEGIEAFQRILVNTPTQVIVSPLDLQAVLDLAFGQKGQPKDGAELSEKEQDAAAQTASASHDQRPDVQTTYVPPVTDIEKKMVEIWQNLIGIEPIGIKDNFFELGGHSLMATQILTRISDIYKVNLPLRLFFEINTIAELGKQIEAVLWVDHHETDSSTTGDREEFAL
jgi:acyl transferase domain-containing protein/acyl carrier protein